MVKRLVLYASVIFALSLLVIFGLRAWGQTSLNGVANQGFSTPTAIFTLPSSDITTSATPSALILSNVTMATPGTTLNAPSPGLYGFSYYIGQTSLGTTCSNGGTVSVSLTYKDGWTGQTITHGVTTMRTSGESQLTGLLLSTSTTATVASSYPILFYAQSGAAITFNASMTANASAGCGTLPTLRIAPYLVAY